MNAAQIIAKFELKVDDTTELSSVEELALLNRIYQFICDDRPWEILKKEGSGTMLTTTTITKPADFAHFVENMNYTDNSISTEENSKPTGILINGVKWLKIINFSDRRQYANQDGYAYLDLTQDKIVTTYPQPSGATYSFDYKRVPDDLTLGTSPVFPDRFHDIFVFAMAVDDMATQLFDKARSYAQENQGQMNSYLQRMAMWNANLQNM